MLGFLRKLGENRTGGVLAAADLNELLDVLDFLRHDGRCGIRRIWIVD